MMILGLTGGIGMGKSTAAKILRQAGARIFDADAEVRRLQAPKGAALKPIAAAFPGTVRNGQLNRAALRALVLANPAALRQLEAIIHPMVRHAETRFLARARADGVRLAVLDIPLLLEAGGKPRVDRVMVVSAPRPLQIARIRRRRRMPDAEITRMIALQMPDAEKRRRADVVIRTGLSRFFAVRGIRRWLEKEGLLS